ncbi:hypothetical protein EW146_g6873 [Bondarzewia mesenterica]|uniref:DNA repair protein RAD16 n=1 Tax=Bondarzewia mesenterica TaxID=1095465 RepID=A0A4S4LP68_9AGAM|nr:hypothetical protein EW146_g6873 [Bondarzewia mesenterica]
MAPRTRKRARSPSTPSMSATATPTTVASALFSGSKRASANATPATSNIDEDEKDSLPQPKATGRLTRAAATKGAKKRAAQSDDDEDQPLSKPPNKKRAMAKTAYVEVPRKSNKGKSVKLAPKDKGKGKAKAELPPTPVADSEDEIVPDSEDGLEYDENASLDESLDSGSEFEDEDAASDFEDQDDEDEEYDMKPRKSSRKIVTNVEEDDLDAVMIDAAIQDSLHTLAVETSVLVGVSSAGAGSSSFRAANTPATRAAQAALRRLAQDRGEDHFEQYPSEDEAALSELSSFTAEDAPLAVQGKGKARAKGGKAAKPADASKQKGLTTQEKRRTKKEEQKEERRIRREEKEGRKKRREEQREERRIARLMKYCGKKEEREMVRRLGRKLTYAEKSTIALHHHHSELRNAWGDLEATMQLIEPKKAEQPAGLKVTLLPFQQESLYWMRKQEFGPYSGGMLADEMGMGKTIQIISLLVSESARPNLVVAPTVAIMQWRNEIAAHTDGMKVLVWHGSGRESDAQKLKKYDVVLTTYAVLESCFRKQHSGFKRKGQIIKEESPLHSVEWHRVILDEAHNIKERATNTAKAAFELQAKFRWCLSGTPLQNRVGELYSLVRFLGGDPFSYYFCKKCNCKSLHWRFSDKRTCDDCGHSPMQHTCFWNNEILTPIQKHGMVGPGKVAFKKLHILLDRIMLRRTKLERADDLDLPPRTVIVRRDLFSPEEKELYLSLFSESKRQFSTYLDAGTLLNNYSNIFSLLTRMRQMACHPDLVIRSKTNAFLPKDEVDEATVCRICNDIAEDAIQAKCRHIFDRECIKQYLNTALEVTPACPVCHLPLTIDLEAPALELEQSAAPRQGILGRLNIDTWRSSSKIEALVEELSNLRRQDATTKSIVFSQFVNFLDLIAFRLQRAGFTVCRLEGTMSPQARDATIQHFMNNVHVTVFLVSLKAGGVALNLTEASRVYLMDSWWNPAVEYQAMDRIHRLGQYRPVQAIKLVIEDSIESRIVQLQEKKSAMVDATLSTDDSAMGRLTPEDVGIAKCLFRAYRDYELTVELPSQLSFLFRL